MSNAERFCKRMEEWAGSLPHGDDPIRAATRVIRAAKRYRDVRAAGDAGRRLVHRSGVDWHDAEQIAQRQHYAAKRAAWAEFCEALNALPGGSDDG